MVKFVIHLTICAAYFQNTMSWWWYFPPRPSEFFETEDLVTIWDYEGMVIIFFQATSFGPVWTHSQT